MRLYVTRHGETQWNREGLAQGSTDIPLNEAGLAQAAELAESLVGSEIDLVITSPLQRAHTTALCVAQRLGVPLIRDQRLIEQSFGRFEGTDYTAGEIQTARHQPVLRAGGGESLLQVAHRVYACLDELPGRCAGYTPLIVAHGLVCRAVHSYFFSMDSESFYAFRTGNCEVRQYDF